MYDYLKKACHVTIAQLILYVLWLRAAFSLWWNSLFDFGFLIEEAKLIKIQFAQKLKSHIMRKRYDNFNFQLFKIKWKIKII